MTQNIRFKGIVGTTAQIATDKFQGRIAFDTTLGRFVVFYDATNYATMARRDVLETFAAGIRNNGDYQDSLGTVRISSTGLVTGSGLAAADLTSGQALVTTTGGRLVSQAYATFLGTIGAVGGRGNGAAGRIVRWSDASTATSDAGLTTTQTGSVTTGIAIGDDTAAASMALSLRSAAGYYGIIRFYEGAQQRWKVQKDASAGLSFEALDASSNPIDQPLSIANAAGSPIILGGGGATKRPVKLTGALQDSAGTQRMSNVGAATMASLQATNLAGTGTRNVVADASGNLSASANVTREFIIQPLPITNAAPGTVNVVDANMKSFGFDGNASTEELFYHVDLQHDYVAGTDIIIHVHWMPSTANAGNVRFQWHYQWVESGGTFTAATLGAPTAVAAGGVAWADKRTDFTISGAGHTYNSRLLLRLFRDPTDGTDTYPDDAVLSSVGVHYTANPIQAG